MTSYQGIAVSVASLITLSCATAMAQGIEPVAEPPAAKGWKLETVTDDLPQPWGMTWLADGRMLVTGKKGTLHLVEGKRVQEVALEGLPALFTSGQGGLLDIAVHPADK